MPGSSRNYWSRRRDSSVPTLRTVVPRSMKPVTRFTPRAVVRLLDCALGKRTGVDVRLQASTTLSRTLPGTVVYVGTHVCAARQAGQSHPNEPAVNRA